MFAVGDVVQLKSGGPHMTVYEIENAVVTTTWFDDAKKPQSAHYPHDALKKVDNGPAVLHPKTGSIA